MESIAQNPFKFRFLQDRPARELWSKTFCVVVCFTLILLWLPAGGTVSSASVSADSHTVCPAGPPTCDYSTIQEAVDAAGTGDSIKVAAGTYSGIIARPAPPGYPDAPGDGQVWQVVYVDKSVSIVGGYTTSFSEPPDPEANLTTVDAQGGGRAIFATGTTSPWIEGLQITGGNAIGLGGYNWDPGVGVGGGIYVITATATITNNQVLSNYAFRGGGMFFFNSDSTVGRNSITDNETTSVFGHGAGVYLYESDATLTDNIISNNTTWDSLSYGGGAFLDHSDALLSGNTFDSNWGYDGGGMQLNYSAATITDNTITNNTTISYGEGGGLYLLYSDAMLEGNTVSGNTADEGGGIFLYDCDADVHGNTVTDNHADNGGGLYLYNVSMATVSDNEISGNTADENGGGLYIDITMADTVVSGNTVTSNAADGDGGGFYLYGRAPTLDGNTIVGNTASDGAGLYLLSCDSPMNANTVIGNSAIWYGGGLYLETSDAELTNNIVADCSASRGTGIYVTGQSSAILRHTTIARNPGGDGTGVYVTGESSLALFNTILANHAVGISAAEGSAASLSGTLWGSDAWANTVDWAGDGDVIVGAPSYWGAPVFVDPDAGDYHIGLGSAAVDVGINAGVATDVDGEARPFDGDQDGVDEFDIGADEITLQFSHQLYLPLILRIG